MILTAIAPVFGEAATIVRFEFLSDFTASEVASDVVATDFNAGSAITGVTLENDGQPLRSWHGMNWTTSNQPSDALGSDSYAWFRFTPQNGTFVTLFSITFDVRPHGSGPDDFLVSVVDVATGLGSQMGAVLLHPDQRVFVGARKEWETLSASSADFENLTGTHEIRIYGFDAKQADREVLFDNVQLDGAVSSIPEPSAGLMLALSGVFLGRRRRRYCAASRRTDRGRLPGDGQLIRSD